MNLTSLQKIWAGYGRHNLIGEKNTMNCTATDVYGCIKPLLLTAYFPPEIGSASHLFYELAESLVEKNYAVTVITGFPRYYVKEKIDKYRNKLFVRERVNGINVFRTRAIFFPGHIPVFRGLWQFSVAFSLFIGGLFTGKQDFIVVYSPPLPLCLSSYLLSKIKRVPFVVNIQDIFPQSAIDLGLLKNRYLIDLFKMMERFIYKKANFVTIHSEGNKKYIINKGAVSTRMEVVPNWVDTDLIKPADKFNQFRKEHSLNEKFIISFVGIMGYSQDLETIIESAKFLKDCKEIMFLLVGDGLEKAGIEKEVGINKLSNVKFLPLQPREKYASILEASDVCLVTLKKEVKTPVVPSKISSIMSSARPLIASMNLNGDAVHLIREAGCGLCIEPENPRMLTQAILKLYNNPELREELGNKGRVYAQKYFSRDSCISKYERIFKEVLFI